MSLFSISDIGIAGIESVVPQNKIYTRNDDIFENEEISAKFEKNTGVKSRYIANEGTCTSDMAYLAASNLLNKLNWDKKEIDILILVTQTADYVSPNTSIILQDKLGLNKSTIAFDLTLGCSGFIYGLSVIMSLMKNLSKSKALLLVGDTLSRQASKLDKSTYPLFGDGVSAIALTNIVGARFDFNLFSDGSGYESIIVPGGMYRNPFSLESLNLVKDESGNFRCDLNTFMQGTDVFSFAIQEVPESINKLLAYSPIVTSSEQIDYFVLHQANKFILDSIRMKLKVPKDKFLISIEELGNTSSASIPMTMTLRAEETAGFIADKIYLFCGFGVGLSLGSVVFKNNSNILTFSLTTFYE